MSYSTNLSASFSQFWGNRSLLSVLLLELVARTLLIILFVLVNGAAVIGLNGVPSTPDIDHFLNAKTVITLAILALVEFFIILYVSSFFSAGFFGMLKNVIQDGATTFHEFLPNAKRYWQPTFRFLLVPYIIMLLSMIPFIFVYTSASAAMLYGARLDPATVQLLVLTLGISLLVLLLLSFLLSYGPAIIVFHDAGAWEASKESMQLAKRYVGKTLAMIITVGIIIGIMLLLVNLINGAISYWLDSIGAPSQAMQFTEFVLSIFVVVAIIIASIFVFQTFDDITMRRKARHVGTSKPKQAIRRKA